MPSIFPLAASPNSLVAVDVTCCPRTGERQQTADCGESRASASASAQRNAARVVYVMHSTTLLTAAVAIKSCAAFCCS